MNNENEKLAQAFRLGWETATKCLQDVYKKGVEPLSEIMVLELLEKNKKKPKKIKEASNEPRNVAKYRAGFRNLLRVGFASGLHISNELFL